MTASEPSIEHRAERGSGAFVALREGAQVGELFYLLEGEVMDIEHTEVDPGERGTGLGLRLLEAAVAWARAEHKRIRPTCRFARATLTRRKDLAAGLLVVEQR